MQRHSERVMHVVIKVGAGADDKVDEAVLHQRNDAAAQPRGRERAGHRQADGDILFRLEHLFSIEAAASLRRAEL